MSDENNSKGPGLPTSTGLATFSGTFPGIINRADDRSRAVFHVGSDLRSLASAVAEGLSQLLPVKLEHDGLRVTTQCMYPSNGLVRVFLRAGNETVQASDEGEAVGEALSAGILLKDPDKLLRPVVSAQGVKIERGVIHTGPMPIASAPLAVLLVANAAKDVAQWLYDHQKIRRQRDFRRLLSDFLKKTFDDRVTPEKIVGKSNKPHKFSNVISFPNGRKLIVDPVANDPASINARVVANLDVASVGNPDLDQRIVYDDHEKWSASDLNLLRVGAVVVPFSRSEEVISRMAGTQRAS